MQDSPPPSQPERVSGKSGYFRAFGDDPSQVDPSQVDPSQVADILTGLTQEIANIRRQVSSQRSGTFPASLGGNLGGASLASQSKPYNVFNRNLGGTQSRSWNTPSGYGSQYRGFKASPWGGTGGSQWAARGGSDPWVGPAPFGSQFGGANYNDISTWGPKQWAYYYSIKRGGGRSSQWTGTSPWSGTTSSSQRANWGSQRGNWSSNWGANRGGSFVSKRLKRKLYFESLPQNLKPKFAETTIKMNIKIDHSTSEAGDIRSYPKQLEKANELRRVGLLILSPNDNEFLRNLSKEAKYMNLKFNRLIFTFTPREDNDLDTIYFLKAYYPFYTVKQDKTISLDLDYDKFISNNKTRGVPLIAGQSFSCGIKPAILSRTRVLTDTGSKPMLIPIFNQYIPNNLANNKVILFGLYYGYSSSNIRTNVSIDGEVRVLLTQI